ncbi:hypothetical protein L484_018238 [Morus notabilis]|uniref:Uncharacterized protein n=1 Tax=Morus notabilis TaxID=981085 RepID=W9QQJ6_9ROSA|nr:hypothetical protein L484_018238 [Morus notabilis]
MEDYNIEHAKEKGSQRDPVFGRQSARTHYARSRLGCRTTRRILEWKDLVAKGMPVALRHLGSCKPKEGTTLLGGNRTTIKNGCSKKKCAG